ncbi:carboxyl transferase domain-containing protein [uncultured Williamsia sp.]|uniref:acyl-CoA carboxylase subunit beta n=1 Tax=uncultured Williamsia sp. TaxID=259311 RepID=UPI00262B32F0|nr:carboxyl transferase domain-containing protein [uncultured Williamsia sp.]
MADVLAAHDAVSDGARPDAVARQHRRGRHTARERIARLSGGRFHEFGALALPAELPGGRDPGAAVADGVVTGVAYVDGRPVAVAAVDFTVLGGSNGAVGMAKMERCVHRARIDRIPLVLLSDGGGHRMQEGLDARAAAAGSPLLMQLVELSGAVPVVSVMMGPGFGVGTNLAALSDFVVMVRGISTLGMSSSPFVAAATGEQMTNEEIGGADVQAGNGVADLAADTEDEALDAVRAFLGFLPSSCDRTPPRTDGPHVPADVDLDAIVPEDGRRPYDVRDVIDGLCDAESVLELRELHAPNVVTALTRIAGRPIGVVANQSLHQGGALDSAACEKAAHFIAVCDAFGLPILTLIDLPGFLIGSAAESSQLARRSGRLAFELGQATVPRFSVVLRKAYGAAYVAMGGGRSNDADLAIAWPTAEICAMPVEGAVDIAYRADWSTADDPETRRSELITELRSRTGALRAAEGFGIDDVVVPSQTRNLLIEAMSRVPDRHPARPVHRFRAISPI